MAADRRVLIIALVAMLVLMGVGVGSAALFATSACGDIGPERRTPGTAASSLAGFLRDVDDPDLTAASAELTALVDALERTFGQVTGVVEAGTATQLAPLRRGVASLGGATTVLEPSGDEVVATATFEEPARVVGDGDRLYSLALINELTGQVDALIPLDRELEPGGCVDTAVVGEPFAFHLDAGGGELLLFRVEEDSDAPELELRDAARGRRWIADLDVPVAPPGVLAERVTAGLGDDVVVSARRVIPGEEEAAVLAVERADGDERWRIRPEALLKDVTDDTPRWVQVLDVGPDLAVLGIATEDERDRASLVAVDVVDGAVRWRAEPDGGPVEVLDARVGSSQVWLAWRDGDEVVLSSLDVRDGSRLGERRVAGGAARIRDGVGVTERQVVTLEGAGRSSEVARTPAPLAVRDVVLVDGRAHALVDVGGGRTVVVSFR